MSALFGLLGIPASGMRTYRTWIDAISDNVANANTVRPTDEAAYQERHLPSGTLDNARLAVLADVVRSREAEVEALRERIGRMEASLFWRARRVTHRLLRWRSRV